MHGKAGSGKNQVATYLSDHGTVTLAFADKIKRLVREVYGFSEDQLWGDSELRNLPDEKYLEKGITLIPRDVLMEIGTAGRRIYENTWANYAEKIIKDLYISSMPPYILNYKYSCGVCSSSTVVSRVIVSDLRFKNEYDMIKNNNGITIKVKRPGAGLTGEKAKHESEAGLPDELFDYVIQNDGTLNDLEVKVSLIKKEIDKM